jgi:PAS domain S-box-containing protein
MTTELIQNATLLISLIVLYGLLSRHKINDSVLSQLINGILFGGIAIIGMNIPIRYEAGIFYDGRTIILSLAGFFCGGLTTLLTVILAGCFRVYLGGPGVWAGIASVVSAALIGYLFRHYAKARPESVGILPLAGMGITVHLAMLSSQLLLPWPRSLEVIGKIWLPVLAIFPLTTVVLGVFLRNGLRRVLAEASIRKSEVLYRTTLHSIGDAVFTTDPQGNLIFLNPAAEKLTGWTEKEAAGKPVNEIVHLIHEDSGEQLSSPVRMILKEGKSITQEKYTLGGNGKEIPVAVSGAPVRDQHDRIAGAVLVFRDQTREKQITDELHAREAMFHTLTEQSPVGIFRTDDKGYTTYVNPKWCQLSGLSRDQALGNAWLDAVHIEDRLSLFKKWKLDNQEGSHSTAQYRFMKPDGSVVWVLGEALPERNADGQISGYVGTITDITEQKKAEQELIRSRENFRQSMDEYPLGMRVVTEDGQTLYMNQALLNIYGFSSLDEYMKTPVEKRYTERGISSYLERKKRRKQGKDVETEYEIEVIRKDGSIRYVHVYRKMLLWDGKFQYLVTYQDHTERKLAQDALIKSENLLKESQELAQIGSWEFDMTEEKTEWSENCFRLFGLRPGEIKPTYDYFRSRVLQEDLYLIDESYEKIRKRKEPVNMRFRITFPDGSIKWLLNKTIPEFKGGKLLKLRGMNMDITDSVKVIEDLEQAKNKAEESDKLKSAFLANMSHEIRTPLNTILGFSSILASEENLSPQDKEDYSAIINRSSDNLLQIINDILDISKLETGQLKIFKSRFDVQTVLEELNRVFGKRLAELEKNNIVLGVDSVSEPVILNHDRVRFYQIFMNLISNSVKFTEEGEIRFGISEIKDHKITFFVSDTGIGIKKEMQPAIFERFRQVGDSPVKMYGGTGLGLSIVKNLVELMGGDLAVESERGKGTVFSFTLPYEK